MGSDTCLSSACRTAFREGRTAPQDVFDDLDLLLFQATTVMQVVSDMEDDGNFNFDAVQSVLKGCMALMAAAEPKLSQLGELVGHAQSEPNSKASSKTTATA